jgi:hypothetical protein
VVSVAEICPVGSGETGGEDVEDSNDCVTGVEGSIVEAPELDETDAAMELTLIIVPADVLVVWEELPVVEEELPVAEEELKACELEVGPLGMGNPEPDTKDTETEPTLINGPVDVPVLDVPIDVVRLVVRDPETVGDDVAEGELNTPDNSDTVVELEPGKIDEEDKPRETERLDRLDEIGVDDNADEDDGLKNGEFIVLEDDAARVEEDNPF